MLRGGVGCALLQLRLLRSHFPCILGDDYKTIRNFK